MSARRRSPDVAAACACSYSVRSREQSLRLKTCGSFFFPWKTGAALTEVAHMAAARNANAVRGILRMGILLQGTDPSRAARSDPYRDEDHLFPSDNVWRPRQICDLAGGGRRNAPAHIRAPRAGLKSG